MWRQGHSLDAGPSQVYSALGRLQSLVTATFVGLVEAGASETTP